MLGHNAILPDVRLTWLAAPNSRIDDPFVEPILLGLANLETAKQLKLSVNTIKIDGKRLHDKLDITTARELFAQLVSYLFKLA